MTTLQIRTNGTITLPAKLRKKYNLNDGEVLSVIDLGDGSLLLTPRQLQVSQLADNISRQLEKDDVNLEDLLKTLDEEREAYYREQYVGK